MKKILRKLIALAIVIMLIQACTNNILEEQITDNLELKSANEIKKGYIVLLEDEALTVELSKVKGYEKKKEIVKSTSLKVLKRAGISDGDIEHVYGSAVKGFSIKIPPGQLKKLQNDPSVSLVEEDRIITLAPRKERPGKPDNGDSNVPPEETPWGITRVGGASNGSGKVAWVIDSGIDSDHPDLFVDKNRCRSFVTTGKYSFEDEHGHGTHVAGTIAALDNEEGVIGVAAGATIVALRVLDKRGSGSFSWTIAALDFLKSDMGGSANDVVNMSLGPNSRYTSVSVDNAVLAVAEKGLKIAIAAGNEDDDAKYYSPASVNHPNVYTVSAMDSDDKFASFSNYGSPVDYCAPGVGVKSCYKNGGYVTWNGTSMAAPHVAGLLLLGNISTDGYVKNDPDGDADPIAHK